MAHRGTVRSKVASEQNFPFPHRTANDVPSGDNEASLRGIFIAEAKEVNPLAQEGFEAGKDSHNDAGQKKSANRSNPSKLGRCQMAKA
jgi:hypothetical protein